MRMLKTVMTLDERNFEVNLPIEKKPTLKEYTEALEVIQKAMLRVIKKEYFNFTKRELILDCLKPLIKERQE